MLIIRPTASLAKRMRVRLGPAAARSTTRLGDWYATDLSLNRRQFILAVSAESRIAVVLPAAPYSTFPSRLPERIGEMLSVMGVTSSNVAAEMVEMVAFDLAKTENRSITGTMIDYKKHLQIMAAMDRLNTDHPLAMSLRISDTPSLVMPGVWPQDVTMKLFGQPPQKKPMVNPFQKSNLILVK